MPKINIEAPKLIDDYIDNSSDFARPILEKLRKLILSVDPKIQEDWKWRAPNYNYKGMVCWLAAFKDHVGINFFKGSLIKDEFGLFEGKGIEEKNNRMIKFNSLDDIDDGKIKFYIEEAIRVNDKGLKPQLKKKELVVPDYFTDVLNRHPKAKEVFDGFSYSNKKDYVEWITEAKRENTRQKRIDQSIEWLNEGKVKNWKYQKC